MARLVYKDLTCDVVSCSSAAVVSLANRSGDIVGDYCLEHGRPRLDELDRIERRQLELEGTKALPQLFTR